MSGPIVTVIFVLLFAGIGGWILYSKKKRRDASWQGTVVDKDIVENVHRNNQQQQNSGATITIGNRQNQAVTYSYTITVKSDTGEEIKWPVSDGFYNQVQIGDQLRKDPGTEIPTIIGATPQPANPTTQQPSVGPLAPGPQSQQPQPPVQDQQPPTIMPPVV